jgi:hypothetical protein
VLQALIGAECITGTFFNCFCHGMGWNDGQNKAFPAYGQGVFTVFALVNIN